MKNVLHDDKNLWVEIFKALATNEKLSKDFSKDCYNNDKLPLLKLFYEISNKIIKPKGATAKFEGIINELNINPETLNSSNKLLKFLLHGLHVESKPENESNVENKEIKEDSNIKSYFFEIEEEARNFFYEKKNRYNSSTIKNNFFGIKKITKKCRDCEKEFYLFKHFQFVPLDLKNVTHTTKLNSINDTLYEKYVQNMDCQFRKKEAEFEIEIEIVKMPEYLIFLLYNYQKDIEIKFLDEKLYKDYKFESFIVKKEKSKLDYLIKKLKCSNVNNKEYLFIKYKKGKFFSENREGKIKYYKKDEIPEKPYFIIYKHESEEKKHGKKNDPDIKSESSKSDTRLNNSKTSSRDKNDIITLSSNSYIREKDNKIKDNRNNIKVSNKINKINISKNICEDDISNDSDDENESKIGSKKEMIKSDTENNGIKKNNNINNASNKINKKEINKNNNNKDFIKKNQEEMIIRLYFKNQENEIYFIDIENTKTFDIILFELNKKFGLSNLDKLNLFFQKNKINKIKSPMNIKIPHGAYIYILPDS